MMMTMLMMMRRPMTTLVEVARSCRPWTLPLLLIAPTVLSTDWHKHQSGKCSGEHVHGWYLRLEAVGTVVEHANVSAILADVLPADAVLPGSGEFVGVRVALMGISWACWICLRSFSETFLRSLARSGAAIVSSLQ